MRHLDPIQAWHNKTGEARVRSLKYLFVIFPVLWTAVAMVIAQEVNPRFGTATVQRLVAQPLATPAAPTATPQGTTGATSRSYRISAINSVGETLASTGGTTATSNASLSVSNFVRVTWVGVPGASAYKVYGRASGSELLMTTVSASSVLRFDDTGALTPSGALPSANTTGGTLGITNAEVLGGTGVAGAAATNTSLTKSVTAVADATATALLTVTVPNAAHSAVVRIRILGSLGAGGAIGANECSAALEGSVAIARTAGVATVATAATATLTSSSCVAGATTMTLAYDLSSVSGSNSATQTFTIRGTITKGGGSSANHTALVMAQVLNGNATGVTVQ